MPDVKQEKIYLLPQTIAYYQKELTRLLEFERYGEAVDMLHFLLGCETREVKAREEWETLLQWMASVFPEARSNSMEEEELSEDELFRRHVRERSASEPDYARKLLSLFRQPMKSGRNVSWDKHILALEQLRHLDHPDVSPVLAEWLRSRPLPSQLQFRAMQILKLRGGEGLVKLKRNGKTYTVDIRDVPAGIEEYPFSLQEIYGRVLRSGVKNGIPLEEFARQTWSEFVAYAYGTPLYMEIAGERREAWAAWSAAFHYTLLKISHGDADEEEIRSDYGISEQLEKRWERAVQVFGDFARTVFPAWT